MPITQPASNSIDHAARDQHEQSTHVPTRLEVRAAARTIAKNVSGVRVPELSTLANDLEALGLSVL